MDNIEIKILDNKHIRVYVYHPKKQGKFCHLLTSQKVEISRLINKGIKAGRNN